MVLAIIVGIGSSFFSQYVNALAGTPARACPMHMSLMLASLLAIWAREFSALESRPAWSPARRNWARVPRLGTAGALVGAEQPWAALPPSGGSTVGRSQPEIGAIRAGTALGVRELRLPIRWRRRHPARAEPPESLQG